jgi:hypothetical protein
LAVLDQFTGRLSWAARLCRWGKAFLGEAYKALARQGSVRRRHRPDVFTTVSMEFWTVDVPFWREFLTMVAAGEWPGVSQWQLLDNREAARRRAVHHVTTDASGHWGAGGVWGWESFAHKWQTNEMDLHISWKELQAIVMAMRRWGPDWAGSRVYLETDNLAAMSYVVRGGGRVPEGRAMMKEIALLAMRYNIDLRGAYIPGVLNDAADAVSRNNANPTTCDYMFSEFERYNDPVHTVDAASAADGTNVQPGCDLFFAAGQRSFLLTENIRLAAGRRMWVNPPFSAVGEFMKAVEAAWVMDERTTATMVVPRWSQKPWFRRALMRSYPLWGVVDIISGSESMYWRGEAARRREGSQKPAVLDEPPGWDTLVLEFPRRGDCDQWTRESRTQ